MATGKPYNMWLGDNFVIVPRSVLRSMFFPRLRLRKQQKSRCGITEIQSTEDGREYNHAL